MSMMTTTADPRDVAHGRSALKRFFGKAFDRLVDARMAQVDPMVKAALARASDEDLAYLGHSPADIAEIRRRGGQPTRQVAE